MKKFSLNLKTALILIVNFIMLSAFHVIHAQTIKHPETGERLLLYPQTFDEKPAFPSPFTTDDGTEIVIAYTQQEKYTLIPVTVGNWEPFDGRYGLFLRGNQLKVDEDDFPTLAKTGLHSEIELEHTVTITGKSIEEISEIGRPERSSGAGFMSQDEDIISVLIGDNRLVQKLGFTHPDLAKPLFHIWNIILKDMEIQELERYWKRFEYILYNGRQVFQKAEGYYNERIVLLKVIGSKGFQESIFNDEIKGSFQIDIRVDLTPEESKFIDEKYPDLDEELKVDLKTKLSSIHFGEMVPYYIKRYGFYEGHTEYRADPISIAFIFGLRSIQEIEAAFPGKLYETLITHFTPDTLKEK